MVLGVQCCDFVCFGQCWIVEDIVDEIREFIFQDQYGLIDMDQFCCVFIDNMYVEQFLCFYVKQQFQYVVLQVYDMIMGCFFEVGNVVFIRNVLFFQFLFGYVDGGNFWDCINVVWKMFRFGWVRNIESVIDSDLIL